MQLRHFLGFALTAASVLGFARPSAKRAAMVHEITMVGDGASYRFEPANVKIRSGDVVRFVMTSGGPHNVAFDAEKIPDAAEAALDANMPDRMQPLSGKLLTNAGESYTVSFAGVAPGAYPYYCMPHMAMGMQGTITVE